MEPRDRAFVDALAITELLEDALVSYREFCFLTTNRVGKTVGGGYAITAHLTGEYLAWWTGKRFRPTTGAMRGALFKRKLSLDRLGS